MGWADVVEGAKQALYGCAEADYGPTDPAHGDTVVIAGEPGMAAYRVAASDPVRRSAVIVGPDGSAHEVPWAALRIVSIRGLGS